MVCGAQLHLLAPWPTQLLSQWMLHWWQAECNAAQEALPHTCPLTLSTRLDKLKVPFFKSSVWPGRYSNPGYQCRFFFWASCSNHGLAAVDLGADVERSLDCLIVQNRQVMQFMGRSMDLTVEDNMVDGLFFCVTLKSHRRGHTPFVQAGAETSDTGAEAVKPDPGSSWEGHSGVGGCRCLGWKCGALWGRPPTPHSIDDPPTAPHLCCCCQMNW